MTENKVDTKIGKKNDKEENSTELNGCGMIKFTNKFDWDFILDREWLRTKK